MASASRPRPGRIRIIGGRYRRTALSVVAAPGLRPTPDRVRQIVFDWLSHLLGDFAGLNALDLFAGTGALGLEMASRGAARVVLADHNATAVAALQAVRRRLDAQQVAVVHADWQAALRWPRAAPYDVIFLDPPFDAGLLPRVVGAARQHLAPRGLLYVESGGYLGAGAAQTMLAPDLELIRAGKAGAVHFHLLRERG